MVNKLQTGGSKKIYVQNAKCNFHLLLKLKIMFKYLMHIHFNHELRKQSYFTESQQSWCKNNVEENITYKIVLSVRWTLRTNKSQHENGQQKSNHIRQHLLS